MNSTALQVVENDQRQHLMNIEEYAMGVEAIVKQVSIIQNVMHKVMQKDQHYGIIPGCGDKPTLLKPGAEKLTMTFRLAPKFKVDMRELGHGHREYEVQTTLYSMVTGAFVGEGVGSCSTMEAKYRFRKAEQKCPKCGKETIIKGKQEYGGGWLCYKKRGGCGAKFKDGDPAIENQEMGRVEHDNPADYFNTCLKMAKKRSLVDATLTATAASDIFTQDIEDMVIEAETVPDLDPTPPPQQKQAAPAKPKQTFTEVMAEMEQALGADRFSAALDECGFASVGDITKKADQLAVYDMLKAKANAD